MGVIVIMVNAAFIAGAVLAVLTSDPPPPSVILQHWHLTQQWSRRIFSRVGGSCMPECRQWFLLAACWLWASTLESPGLFISRRHPLSQWLDCKRLFKGMHAAHHQGLLAGER